MQSSACDASTALGRQVASYGKLVVSTGGGVVATKANWGHLHNGIVVYLYGPVKCAPPAHPRHLGQLPAHHGMVNESSRTVAPLGPCCSTGAASAASLAPGWLGAEE